MEKQSEKSNTNKIRDSVLKLVTLGLSPGQLGVTDSTPWYSRFVVVSFVSAIRHGRVALAMVCLGSVR